MLSAAVDLLKKSNEPTLNTMPYSLVDINSNSTATQAPPHHEYCNKHSTSTILLADTIPSLATKIIYPFLLVGIATGYKASAAAILSAASFLLTGLTTNLTIIFTGVVCAALSSGLGEATYLSSTPLYGDASLGGWAIGTGAAGLVGAGAYALLTMILSPPTIMFIMLIVPVAMMISYNFLIVPTCNHDCNNESNREYQSVFSTTSTGQVQQSEPESLSPAGSGEDMKLSRTEQRLSARSPIMDPDKASTGSLNEIRNYGIGSTTSQKAQRESNSKTSLNNDQQQSNQSVNRIVITTNHMNQSNNSEKLDFNAKMKFLPRLRNYFLPLLLVYFAEYFINQGLFELIYFKDISFLDKDAQYRWFQVFYQIGVMISRSTIEIFRIKNIWIMSILQLINVFIFLGHVTKLYNIPSFYLVLGLIIYEGLLGGFTYVNAFFRIRKEIEPSKLEFAISTATLGDSLGIVAAGFISLPVHNELCKLYQ